MLTSLAQEEAQVRVCCLPQSQERQCKSCTGNRGNDEAGEPRVDAVLAALVIALHTVAFDSHARTVVNMLRTMVNGRRTRVSAGMLCGVWRRRDSNTADCSRA